MAKTARFALAPAFVALGAILAMHQSHADQTTSASELPLGPFSFHEDPNVFIPMRDGVRLSTDLYLPDGPKDSRYPIVLIRTPYGDSPHATGRYNDPGIKVFASHGYVVAVQEVRGKFGSEGTFTVSTPHDPADGYDTVEWLSKQPWSNGRVGTFGCSYEGDEQLFMAQTRPPALKAMIPQASGSSVWSAGGLYRQLAVREGGAIFWAAAVGWFAGNGAKVSPTLPASLPHDQYNAYYRAWHEAPKVPALDYQRAWYTLPMVNALSDQGMPPSDFEDNISTSPSSRYWKRFPYMTSRYISDVPALFVNSWYDFGPDVTLFEFNWYRTRSASALGRDNQYFVMSPGVHCSSESEASAHMVVGTRPMGDTRFDYWQTYLTWFGRWLKDDAAAKAKIEHWPRLRYYLMGTDVWKTADSWPVPGSRPTNFYLSSSGRANSVFGNGKLSIAQPSTASLDSFTYDPGNPVPTLGGALCCTGTPDAPPGAMDQRPVEARNDVLVFTTKPLSAGVNVTGQVELDLFVSSTAVDTDFTAKLVDVYPDGRAFNVLEGILRARYREGQTKEVWMRPGKVYPLRISLGATSNYFGPGHQIRLEVSSSNFPEFDRNLNIGGNNAEGTHWVKATNSVYYSAKYPSHLVLPVVGP